MNAEWGGVLALVGVIATAFVTYLLGARKISGSVEHSEATVLWDAADKLRKDLFVQMSQMRQEIIETRQQLDNLEAINQTLRDQVRQLESENRTLRARVAELETRVNGS